MDELRLSLLALFVAVIAGIYLFDTLRRRGATRPQAQPPQTRTDAGPGRDARAEHTNALANDAAAAEPQQAQDPRAELSGPDAGHSRAARADGVYPDGVYPDDVYSDDGHAQENAPDGACADAAPLQHHEVRQSEAEDQHDIPLGDIDRLQADASAQIDLGGTRDAHGTALSDVLRELDEQPFNEDRLMAHAHAGAAREDEPFAQPFSQGQLDLDGHSSRREPRLEGAARRAPRGDELIVVLHVMRPDRSIMPGGEVQAALGMAQLELGEMSIYHHYGLTFSGAHQPVFSVARAVEPGTFDAQDERTYDTPGLTLFMRLPGPQDGAVVLELMFNTAQTLARDLEASVLDDRRTPLSAQALNHLRDKVAEFSRRQKLVAS